MILIGTDASVPQPPHQLEAAASAPAEIHVAMPERTTAERERFVDLDPTTTIPTGPTFLPAADEESDASSVEATDGDSVIAPPPDTFEVPPAPPVPPPSRLTGRYDHVQPADGTWAVIIGINDYPGTHSDLRSAVNDANDIDRVLSGYGVPADRRLVLRDRQASAANIRDAFRWLVAHAGDDATAVVYYAGHVRKLSRSTEAIVAADGRLVTDEQMANDLSDLRAEQTWIAMASCYGGGFTEVLAAGRILSAAADANSLAYENSRYGRSYFGEYMVNRAMLQGMAPQSVEKAFAFAVEGIRRDHPNRQPIQFDYQPGDLVLGPPPASSPSSADGGSAQQPPPPSGDGGSQPPAEEPPPDEDGPRRCTFRVNGVVTYCRR
ncbi:MAG TPA: caspase family protein [Acidimicrobiales bacterium]|nr:caspase family protein [Acidimicrobiales bacterium]